MQQDALATNLLYTPYLSDQREEPTVSSSDDVRSRFLEPISKLLQEHRDTGELHKAKEIGGVVLPTN